MLLDMYFQIDIEEYIYIYIYIYIYKYNLYLYTKDFAKILRTLEKSL